MNSRETERLYLWRSIEGVYLRKRRRRAGTRPRRIFIRATFIAPGSVGTGALIMQRPSQRVGEGHVGSLAERVKQLLANHPPLTAEQRARIVALLR